MSPNLHHIASDFDKTLSNLSWISTPVIFLKLELSSIHLDSMGLYQSWELHCGGVTGSNWCITESTDISWKADYCFCTDLIKRDFLDRDDSGWCFLSFVLSLLQEDRNVLLPSLAADRRITGFLRVCIAGWSSYSILEWKPLGLFWWCGTSWGRRFSSVCVSIL